MALQSDQLSAAVDNARVVLQLPRNDRITREDGIGDRDGGDKGETSPGRQRDGGEQPAPKTMKRASQRLLSLFAASSGGGDGGGGKRQRTSGSAGSVASSGGMVVSRGRRGERRRILGLGAELRRPSLTDLDPSKRVFGDRWVVRALWTEEIVCVAVWSCRDTRANRAVKKNVHLSPVERGRNMKQLVRGQNIRHSCDTKPRHPQQLSQPPPPVPSRASADSGMASISPAVPRVPPARETAREDQSATGAAAAAANPTEHRERSQLSRRSSTDSAAAAAAQGEAARDEGDAGINTINGGGCADATSLSAQERVRGGANANGSGRSIEADEGRESNSDIGLRASVGVGEENGLSRNRGRGAEEEQGDEDGGGEETGGFEAFGDEDEEEEDQFRAVGGGWGTYS